MTGVDRLAQYMGQVLAENANLKRQKQMMIGYVNNKGVKINGKTYASHQAVEMKLVNGAPVVCAFIGSSKRVVVLGQ